MSVLTLAAAPVLPSILAAIGHTPLVRLHLPGVPPGVELWGKCEWFNPGGSVKDRTALSLVAEGERTGALRPGQVIVDSSSGNTAVGLALVGRARGYAVELVMPAERGARSAAPVRGLRRSDRGDGRARRIRRRPRPGPVHGGRESRALLLRRPVPQPGQPPGALPHDGPRDLGADGRARDPLRRGPGDHGDDRGRQPLPARAAAAACAWWRWSRTTGSTAWRASSTWPARSSPRSTTRRPTTSGSLARTEDAYATCAEALASDGLLVGHSAGAALWAAREVARSLRHGVVVALLPDGGERYLPEGARV